MMFLHDHENGGKAATLEESQKAQGRAAATPAQWTVLAYLAGDNDLEGVLLDDLKEMERVGSRPGTVEILAQLDRAPGGDATGGDWSGTRRYYVTRSATPARLGSKLLADLGDANTGDPALLEDFLSFGTRRFPARATMLVLSNHGSGLYVPPEMLSRRDRRRARAARRQPRGFFRTTRERLLDSRPPRGIAYDDGSGDCLDNRELKPGAGSRPPRTRPAGRPRGDGRLPDDDAGGGVPCPVPGVARPAPRGPAHRPAGSSAESAASSINVAVRRYASSCSSSASRASRRRSRSCIAVTRAGIVPPWATASAYRVSSR
jgi:hypothetical protein